MNEKKINLGLIPKLIIAIVLGILIGKFLPESVVRAFVTISANFGKLLSFIIPLMIIAFVTKGISDLSEGAGKLLLVTVVLSYVSTLVAGSASYFMSSNIFPSFISTDMIEQIKGASDTSLEAYFTIPLSPMVDVTGALVFAFIFGLCISALRQKGHTTMYNLIGEFSEAVNAVLEKAIVPFLPIFIMGNFANMTYSGSVFAILNVFIKIFGCIVTLHIIYLIFAFILAGSFTKKNPLSSLKKALPAYFTAIGTQSSAATIPVNVNCNKNIGVTKQIREFVIPLCATCHMPGSMITITGCTFTLLHIYAMPHSYGLILQFIAILGIAMVAAPGAPGGAVMSALPFLPVVGIASDSPIASILIMLYLTQDSFGTAANVTGDNAISMMVEKIYYKNIVKKPIPNNLD